MLLSILRSRPSVRLALLVIIALLALPAVSFGQLWSQPQFSITPSAVDQGACYTISVPNWAPTFTGQGQPTLSVYYYTEWSGYQYIYWWPTLDWNGNARICTDSQTVPGTYLFVQVTNNYYWYWWNVNTPVTVNAPAPPQQPTSLTFSNSEGYAGNDCYVMTAGNGINMTIDLLYQFNYLWQPEWSADLNASGQWPYCLNHYDRLGKYDFYVMKNHLRSDWINVAPVYPATYIVRPPQPKWFTISPALITRGQSYNLAVGNGANVTLDMQYALNGTAKTIIGWPSLGNYGAPNPDGPATIVTDAATATGKYVFTAMRNTWNTAWIPISVPLTICPAEAPAIASITPSSGVRGSAVSVTISGANLCNVSLSTTGAGLTISNVTWNAPFTSVTATFNISSTAPAAAANVQLTTPVSSATTQFTITPPLTLTKEYIYIGGRLIAVERPPQ